MDDSNCQKRSHESSENGNEVHDTESQGEPSTKKLRLGDQNEPNGDGPLTEPTVASNSNSLVQSPQENGAKSADAVSPHAASPGAESAFLYPPPHAVVLPDEALDRILSHLSLTELCRSARGVCKAWKRVADRSDAWKFVDICRHWRQNAFSLSTPASKPKSLPLQFVTGLRKLRKIHFSTKFRQRRHSTSSSQHTLSNPIAGSSSALSYPRCASTDVVLNDLASLLRDKPMLESLDLSDADLGGIPSPEKRFRYYSELDVEDDAEWVKCESTHQTIRISNPRLPPEQLVAQAFSGLRQINSFSVETRNFAAIPYAPSIASQSWARSLKSLSLKLCPREQGLLAPTRFDATQQIAVRSNYHSLGSLQPLVESCPVLSSLAIEVSFGVLPASAWPHLFRPLRQIASKGKLKDLRIGLLCLTHVIYKFDNSSRTLVVAVSRLNQLLDDLFETEKREMEVGGEGGAVEGTNAESDKSSENYHPFFGLEVFHLTNLEGPFAAYLPVRLITLEKLLVSVKCVRELTITGFKFPMPFEGSVSLAR